MRCPFRLDRGIWRSFATLPPTRLEQALEFLYQPEQHESKKKDGLRNLHRVDLDPREPFVDALFCVAVVLKRHCGHPVRPVGRPATNIS